MNSPSSLRSDSHDVSPNGAVYERHSFSRRGDRLHGRRLNAWNEHRDKYVLPIDRKAGAGENSLSVDPEFTLNLESIFSAPQATVINPASSTKTPRTTILEIGSGLGETIVSAASKNPHNNYLAAEVFTPGLASTIIRAEQENLSNLRLLQANAPELLSSAFEPHSLDEIWVFFPDPWPKKRHHKRRLISADFLDRVTRVLKQGGTLRIASDWDHYNLAMRDLLEEDSRFSNLYPGKNSGDIFRIRDSKSRPGGASAPELDMSEDETIIDSQGGWAPRFEQRPLTSFEKKAKMAGRVPHDLAFQLNLS